MRFAQWPTLAVVIWLASTSVAGANDPAADLYYQGLAEVEATLPSSGLAMPSTAMPCINCHGADGQGGREGGVAVPPISWRRLSMATADRPAYGQIQLARALRDGIGGNGAPLHAIMPRYAISDALAADLAGWLEAIGPKRQRGVSDQEIVIAIPSTKTDDARAVVIAAVLRDFADNLNRKGGLYGRKLRLVEDEPGRQEPFARLAALEPRASNDDAPLDLWPLFSVPNGRGAPDGRPAFPLIPSADRLMQSLLEAAQRDDPAAQRLSELVGNQRTLPKVIVFEGSADALSTFVDGWSGPASLSIYTTLDHIDLAQLQFLSPRPLKVVLANPLAADMPADRSKATTDLMAFERAAERLRLPETAEPVAKAAWVAASLLEKTLRATGRTLDRKRFEQALRSMTTFESGLLLPVHPTRGLTSIALVTFDFAANKITRQTLAVN